MTNEEQTLAEVRAEIGKLPGAAQIHVEAIAMTLRNIVKADELAPMAFALVGAELAAQP